MTASMPRSRSGCVSLVSEPRFRSLTYFVTNLIFVMSSIRIMPPRRDQCPSTEPSFPDISLLGEVIASAIQSVIRHPQRTPLETVYSLKLPNFMGNEGHVGSERWLENVEKTFQVMQSQGSLAADRWVKTVSWFLDREHASWWGKRLTGGLLKRKQIGGISSGRFIRDSFLRHIWIRRSHEFTNLKQEEDVYY